MEQNEIGIGGCSCTIPPHETHMDRIDPQLRKLIEEKVSSYSNNNMTAFDVAVDIAYSWKPALVCTEEEYTIPTYVIEIVESIMGPDINNDE